MHLIVDQPRQDMAPLRIDHLIRGACRQTRIDSLDTVTVNQDIGLEDSPLVYERAVDD